MPSRPVVRVVDATSDSTPAQQLREGLMAIADEHGLARAFLPEVEADAARAAAAPRLPDLDRTDLPLLTVDPAGARDLDQALHLARTAEGGYEVHYAIADVAAFVDPGSPVDLESQVRGETFYGGGSRIPLHPPVLSEGAASLLPGEERPALLWTIVLDEDGARLDARVERARVRSRRRLSYEEAQAAIDGTGTDTGTEADVDTEVAEVLGLLAEVGRLRVAREAARGAVSLPLPDQEVRLDAAGDDRGEPRLVFRSMLPVEEWNAQISLLTGFAAAALMVYARVGFLRTLPPADPADVQRLHRTARALGLDWPAEQLYPDFVRTLDPDEPRHAAMLVACTRVLRGAGYVAFDGEVPADPEHAALAAPYAHVTAPLRRLGDRYASEVCLSLCTGDPVPDWVHREVPDLAHRMQRADQAARRYERAVLDLVEAILLQDRVGERFEGVVVSVDADDERRGVVVVGDLGVEAPVTAEGPLPLGTEVAVTLDRADVDARAVAFVLSDVAPPG